MQAQTCKTLRVGAFFRSTGPDLDRLDRFLGFLGIFSYAYVKKVLGKWPKNDPNDPSKKLRAERGVLDRPTTWSEIDGAARAWAGFVQAIMAHPRR